MILYYVRHGDPIYTPDSLTELGIKQADALSKRFQLYGLDEIYSSTSIRAQMTAQPTCDLLHKEKTLLDWTNENYVFSEFTVEDEMEGCSWIFQSKKYKALFNTSTVQKMGMKWYKDPIFKDLRVKSGMERVGQEADSFLAMLGFKHIRENGCYKVIQKNSKRIALFAHEAFGKAFLSHVLDIPYPIVSTRMQLGHSSVTVLYFDENQELVYPQILQWSNDSHLYKEHLLTGYQNKLDI